MTGDRTRESGSERWPAAAFAAALRGYRAKAGLSRQQLAQAVGLDRSVLSRLERGQYRHRLSECAIAKLSTALACGDALFEAAGRPTPEIQRLISDPLFARAFANPEAARRGLRKLHLQEVASSVVNPSYVPDGRAVDIARLWRAVRERAGLPPAPPPEAGPGEHARTQAAGRFVVSHATAHLLLETRCSWPYMGSDSETEASELAGLLLTPPGPLTQAARAAFSAGLDPWDADADGLIAAVADYLLIPGWLAAYRLGDFPGIHVQLLPVDEELA
ncbi:helix-turn-helix transcriptional regulator [Streptomyces sp. NPDC049097]|uniref:helix-turn-helix domain-containing protein n=1 Tax=Streptomyces sp. NPDC049097 TaxID=3155497 RepID=UPI00341EA0DE